VEVTVPYTLAAGEDPDNLSVYFINDAGELEKIACRYVDGHVVFTTNHFSYYAVVYESVAKFVDVTMADWYYDSVSRVVGAGLFRGTSETEFSPATKMSRAMVVTVIHRLDGETQVSGVNEFTDVPADTWYTDAVIWAAQNGIVDGYGDGRFGPGDDVTREQLAAILFRYVSFKGKGPTGLWAVELTYPDKALISDYAVEPAMWCQIHGIVTGFEDGSFAPQGLATRAEVATMLDRYMAKFVE